MKALPALVQPGCGLIWMPESSDNARRRFVRAGWASYVLTTLRQEPARIAREVVAILDRRDADPGRSPISVHPVDLVVRGTVRGLACPSTTT